MASLTLEWERLEPFGVEVHIDDVNSLTEPDQARLRELFEQEHLLVFRGLEMTAEEQKQLGAYLGPLVDYTNKQYISNTHPEGYLGDQELKWHSDMLYAPEPYIGIGLHAIDVQPGRTSTKYANGARAAAALSAEVRAAVSDKWAVHVQDASYGSEGGYQGRHEVLWIHPASQTEVILVDELHRGHIEGLDPAESSRLMDELAVAYYRPDNIYEHRWYPNDCVIWDNLVVQHARDPLPPDVGTRTLRKIVLGTKSGEEQMGPEHFSRVAQTANDEAAFHQAVDR